MGAICGKNGTVNGSGATIRSWSINIETDLLDATTMGSNGYREFIECLTGATGSLTATERFAGCNDQPGEHKQHLRRDREVRNRSGRNFARRPGGVHPRLYVFRQRCCGVVIWDKQKGAHHGRH